jgi:hypothetical protein
MTQFPYPYIKVQPDRYIFISRGRKRIAKVVEFVELEIESTMNLVFGDLLPDNTIESEANSDNGDMRQVLVTVVEILIDYTQHNTSTQILILGNTEVRKQIVRTGFKNKLSGSRKKIGCRRCNSR